MARKSYELANDSGFEFGSGAIPEDAPARSKKKGSQKRRAKPKTRTGQDFNALVKSKQKPPVDALQAQLAGPSFGGQQGLIPRAISADVGDPGTLRELLAGQQTGPTPEALPQQAPDWTRGVAARARPLGVSNQQLVGALGAGLAPFTGGTSLSIAALGGMGGALASSPDVDAGDVLTGGALGLGLGALGQGVGGALGRLSPLNRALSGAEGEFVPRPFEGDDAWLDQTKILPQVEDTLPGTAPNPAQHVQDARAGLRGVHQDIGLYNDTNTVNPIYGGPNNKVFNDVVPINPNYQSGEQRMQGFLSDSALGRENTAVNVGAQRVPSDPNGFQTWDSSTRSGTRVGMSPEPWDAGGVNGLQPSSPFESTAPRMLRDEFAQAQPFESPFPTRSRPTTMSREQMMGMSPNEVFSQFGVQPSPQPIPRPPQQQFPTPAEYGAPAAASDVTNPARPRLLDPQLQVDPSLLSQDDLAAEKFNFIPDALRSKYFRAGLAGLGAGGAAGGAYSLATGGKAAAAKKPKKTPK